MKNTLATHPQESWKNIVLFYQDKPTKRNSKNQRGRQKSFSKKTDKTMANKMKRRKNIEYTTLH